MSPQLSHALGCFVMCVLVVLFVWIYLRYRQQRVGLWLAGWIAISVHFATSLVFTFHLISERLANWLAVPTLEIAGACFLFSVSKAFATTPRRLYFSLLFILPSILYWTFLLFGVQRSWAYGGLLILLTTATVGAILRHHGCKRVIINAFCIAMLVAATWVVLQVPVRPDYGIDFALCTLFTGTGLVYWLHYRRVAPGIVVTSIAFIAWGLVFPVGALLGNLHWGIPDDSVLWDLPKYFVAFGMTLTLFENQTEMLSLEIAERRRAEESALAANEAKSAFLATMSHEIRTPMNGILGLTDLLMSTELTEDQRSDLGLIKTCADSLLVIINDVLDFSKIEARKLDFERIPFNLRHVVGDTVKTMQLRAAEAGLELFYDVRPRVPALVIGDPGRLRQVLLNLVGNAVKFTKQGHVAVSVEAEHIDDRATMLHFTVTDTGIGIPMEKRDLIFEAFTQADGSTTRKYGGTGLGLAICSRLVEMMNGRIWVESGPENRGSAFHFTARFDLSGHDPAVGETVLQEVRSR